ncbi:RRP6 [Candida margitis]|uniref:RRP6 n=1 Tax=Candida margitis TaxID=1775924 RepID=UPI002227295E|nr:RRP6 [Candida margitis]KAI5970471.1 RRP6 [Candida margitis]
MSTDEQDIFKDVLPKLMGTIRAATALAAQDVNFYKSVDSNTSQEIDKRGKNLLTVTNDLLRTASSQTNPVDPIIFGQENISSESSWNPVSNVIDSIFEKIDYTFDSINKKQTGGEQKQYLEDGNSSIPSGQAQRIEKPQLKFKIPVDNSEQEPFKPKITIKPNALQPLEAVNKLTNPAPIYEDSIEVVDPPYYVHPYEYEIDTQPYPESILQKSEPILPQDWSSTSAIWIDTKESLNEMIEELSSSSEIAVDLEHHDYRSYYGIVCLMQISNRDKDWIIDTLVLRDDLSVLNKIFTDPKIVKVLHGAFMDIIWLQRDLGLYIVSLFDTYHASRQLGFSKFSLQYLLDTFANFRTSKKYQLADWRIRPLPKPMLAYARSDTHFLLYIFDQLRNKLIDSDKLARVLFDSRQVAKRRFEYTKFRPLSNNLGSKVSCPVMSSNPNEPWGSIMYQYNVPSFKRPVVEQLYKWRDLIARQEDESVRYIMPNQLLVSLATLESPVDAGKVLNVPSYVSEHVRLNARELAELIDKTLKESEQNDWAIVDRWNNQSSVEVEEQKVDIKAVNVFLEKLLSDSAALFTEGSLLNSKSSVVIPSVSVTRNITYDFTDKGVKQHNFDKEEQNRFDYVWKKLTDISDTASITDKELEVEIEAEEVTKPVELSEAGNTEDKPKSGQQILFSKNDDINPDELIALRKTNKNVKRKNSQLAQEDEPSIDYANADKILIDPKRSEKRKKRSFDPYGKDAAGPRPAKKKKVMAEGKTSTYKLKQSRSKK